MMPSEWPVPAVPTVGRVAVDSVTGTHAARHAARGTSLPAVRCLAWHGPDLAMGTMARGSVDGMGHY
jgi:hypothetical protein